MPKKTPLPPSKRRLRPRTYAIGLYVLGLFILIELVALGFVAWSRKAVVNLETSGPVLIESGADDLLGGEFGLTEPQVAPLPAPEIKGRLTLPIEENPEFVISQLNEEASAFRNDRDFIQAEETLKRALLIDPSHGLTLTNYALLEEQRNRPRRALNYWRRVIETGVNVELARERARIMEEQVAGVIEEEALGRLGERLRKDIGIASVVTRPDPIPDNPAELEVDFEIKIGKEGLRVEARKLKVQLFFYDRIGADRLSPAKIDAQFLNPAPDWSTGSEVLRAKYISGLDNLGEQRRYYGYLIRVFYDGELQDQQARPSAILRLFPPE
jgi:tetratricopeptide (TPR) repeat protein